MTNRSNNGSEIASANQEIFPMQANYEGFLSNRKIVPNEVHGRFVFSNYLIDPNRFSFRKVVRILAYVLKFIRKCRYPNESHRRHDIEHLIRSKASSSNILPGTSRILKIITSKSALMKSSTSYHRRSMKSFQNFKMGYLFILAGFYHRMR